MTDTWCFPSLLQSLLVRLPPQALLFMCLAATPLLPLACYHPSQILTRKGHRKKEQSGCGNKLRVQQTPTQSIMGTLIQTQTMTDKAIQAGSSPSEKALPQTSIELSNETGKGGDQTTSKATSSIQEKKVTFEILTKPSECLPVMMHLPRIREQHMTNGCIWWCKQPWMTRTFWVFFLGPDLKKVQDPKSLKNIWWPQCMLLWWSMIYKLKPNWEMIQSMWHRQQ